MCLSWRINAAKLISGLRSGARVEIYVRDHFNLLWCQFTNMHNLQAQHQPHTSSTCPVTSPDGSFPAHRGAQRGSASAEQRVLTLYLKARWGMSSRKRSKLEDLLMFCDSCCQQFSSALSSCNFQPSSPHWYRFKKPLLHCSTHAVRSIDCLLWFSFLHYMCIGKYLENSQPMSRLCCDIFKLCWLEGTLF